VAESSGAEVAAESPAFDTVLRGYDRTQVDRFLAETEAQRRAVRALHAEVLAEGARLAELAATLTRERAAFEAERDGWQPSFATLGEGVEKMVRELRAEVAEQRARVSRETAAASTTAAHRRALLEQELLERRREAQAQAGALLERGRVEGEATLAAAREQAAQIVAAAREHAGALERYHAELVAEMTRVRVAVDTLTDDLLAAAAHPPRQP
jgi:DivIVA domain-containing protein